MKHLICISFMILGLALNVKSQTILMPNENTIYDDNGYDIIETQNGNNFWVLVNRLNPSNISEYLKQSELYYLAADGSVLKHSTFKTGLDSSYFLCNIFEINANEFVVMGMHNRFPAGVGFIDLFSCVIDTNLNISGMKYSNGNSKFKPLNMTFKRISSGYIGDGLLRDTTFAGLGSFFGFPKFTVNRDSILTAMLPLSGFALDIEEQKDSLNNFILYGPFGSCDYRKLDSNLIVYDSAVFAGYKPFEVNCITHLSSSKYLIYGGIFLIPSMPIGLQKMDIATKQLLTKDTMPIYPAVNTIQSGCSRNNGVSFINPNTIFYGGLSNNAWAKNYINIACVDSNVQKKWHRRIGGDKVYLLSKIQATQDGGCVVLGQINDSAASYLMRDLFIFKLDSVGTLTSINVVLPQVDNPYTLYPNPIQNDFTILDNGEGEYKLSIWNTLGEVMLSKDKINVRKQIIPLASFKSGTYLYSIITQSGKKQSGLIEKK